MRRWIGVPIIILCLAGLAWISLPVPMKSTVYESNDPVWGLKIVQPDYLRAGDSGTLTVEVSPSEIQGTAFETAVVAMRLDFPGLFQGANEATQMVDPGKSVRFPWTLGPASPGSYEGRIWIYSGLNKTLLNARTVQVVVHGPDAPTLYILRVALLLAVVGIVILVFFRRSACLT